MSVFNEIANALATLLNPVGALRQKIINAIKTPIVSWLRSAGATLLDVADTLEAANVQIPQEITRRDLSSLYTANAKIGYNNKLMPNEYAALELETNMYLKRPYTYRYVFRLQLEDEMTGNIREQFLSFYSNYQMTNEEIMDEIGYKVGSEYYTESGKYGGGRIVAYLREETQHNYGW